MLKVMNNYEPSTSSLQKSYATPATSSSSSVYKTTSNSIRAHQKLGALTPNISHHKPNLTASSNDYDSYHVSNLHGNISYRPVKPSYLSQHLASSRSNQTSESFTNYAGQQINHSNLVGNKKSVTLNKTTNKIQNFNDGQINEFDSSIKYNKKDNFEDDTGYKDHHNSYGETRVELDNNRNESVSKKLNLAKVNRNYLLQMNKKFKQKISANVSGTKFDIGLLIFY
jgi:hypothetical protein